MNAVELLKEDHRIVDALFEQVESTPPSRHPALFKRIKGELDTHAHVEEVIFYPALKKRGNKDLVDIVLEGVEEHGQMKKFLGELASLTVGSETYEPKLKVLIEDTRHHVKEEERRVTGMFALAQDQLEPPMLERLGEEMEAEKQKFQTKNGIKPEPRTGAKGALEVIVDKAMDAVSGIFSSNHAKPKKATKTTSGKAPARASAKPSASKTTATKAAKGVAKPSKPAAKRSAVSGK